jgi:hypothetical protein
VPHIEAYVAHLLYKEAYNPAAHEQQQRMKKGATRAAKCAHTKVNTTMVTTNQLDCELASARPPSPPPYPAASAAWHHDNGLAQPDHLTTQPSLTTQEAESIAEATAAEPAGTPQPDPQPPPAPYINVQMWNVEDIVDWELPLA